MLYNYLHININCGMLKRIWSYILVRDSEKNMKLNAVHLLPGPLFLVYLVYIEKNTLMRCDHFHLPVGASFSLTTELAGLPG